jgi:hypothetical protein
MCRSTRVGRKGEHGQGVYEKDGGTHDEQYGDGVLAAYGDDVRRVCVVAGTDDVDECAMVVSEVHKFRSNVRGAAQRVPSLACEGANQRFMKAPHRPRGAPHPALFVAIALSSFAAYYTLVHYRAATAPASSRPRPNDHPLVWPVHSPDQDQDRDGTQPHRENR